MQICTIIHDQDLLYSRHYETQDIPSFKAIDIHQTGQAHVPHVEDASPGRESLQTGLEASDLADVPLLLGDQAVDPAADEAMSGGADNTGPARRDEAAPDQSGQIQRGCLRQEDSGELQQGKVESELYALVSVT